MGGLSYAHAIIFQWLNQTLCGKDQIVKPDVTANKAFIEIFKKYGGEIAEKRAQELLETTNLI